MSNNNFYQEYFSGTFFGTPTLESLGEILYKESTTGITCKLQIGGIKGQPSDGLYGEIISKEGKILSKITGSYLSHIDFDGETLWDIRTNFPINLIEFDNSLPSSSIYREDRKLLEKNLVDDAQEMKEKIENIQRNDRKLREKWQKKQGFNIFQY